MAQATIRITPDKQFVTIETPDAEWEPQQVNSDGINMFSDDDNPADPAYLVITEDSTVPDVMKNKVYQLVPLDTSVVEVLDFDDDEDEEEEEPQG